MVLRRSRGLARLAAAELISPLGDTMATVAVLLHLQSGGGTGTTVAAVLVAEAAPTILSPLAGTLADRVTDVRRLIAGAAAVQAVVVAAIAIALPELGLVALGASLFVRAALDTASGPALGSIVPAVVRGDDLAAANGVISAAREAGSILGAPAAGLLFAIAGPRWVLVVDALTFAAVVPLVLWVPRMRDDGSHRGDGGDVPASRWREDVIEGLRIVWRTPRLRAVAIGFWVTVFFSAPDDLVLAFLARDDLGAGPVAVGVVLAGASFGLVVATPAVRAVARRLGTPMAAIVAGGLTMALGNLLTALSPAVAVAFATQALRGSGIALMDAAGVRTLIQRDAPRASIGRVFANVYGGVSVAAALGYVAGGPFLDATTPRVAFVVIGAGGFAGVALTVTLVRPRRAPTAPAADGGRAPSGHP